MYQEIKLYQEIRNEMANVMEAEANSAAWKQEGRTRMKDVTALITAAKKVNKGIEIDAAALIKEIRESLTPVEEAETPETPEAQ